MVLIAILKNLIVNHEYHDVMYNTKEKVSLEKEK